MPSQSKYRGTPRAYTARNSRRRPKLSTTLSPTLSAPLEQPLPSIGCKQKLEEALYSLKTAQAAISAKEAEITLLNNQLRSCQTEQTEQTEQLNSQLSRLKSEHRELLEKLEQTLERAQKELAESKEETVKCNKELEQTRTNLDTARGEIGSLTDEKARLERECNDRLEELKSEFQQQVENVKKEFDEFRQRGNLENVISNMWATLQQNNLPLFKIGSQHEFITPADLDRIAAFQFGENLGVTPAHIKEEYGALLEKRAKKFRGDSMTYKIILTLELFLLLNILNDSMKCVYKSPQISFGQSVDDRWNECLTLAKIGYFEEENFPWYYEIVRKGLDAFDETHAWDNLSGANKGKYYKGVEAQINEWLPLFSVQSLY